MPSSAINPASTQYIRVEPKVFFANERTFLSWLNFSVMLGGLALGLLNFGSDKVGRVSGIIFTIIAMGIMIFALWLYLWRAQMIRKRAGGPYDSRMAPIFIVVILLAAICINFILRLTVGSESAPTGGSDGASP